MALLYIIYVLPVIHFHSQLWYEWFEWQTGSCGEMHVYMSTLCFHACCTHLLLDYWFCYWSCNGGTDEDSKCSRFLSCVKRCIVMTVWQPQFLQNISKYLHSTQCNKPKGLNLYFFMFLQSYIILSGCKNQCVFKTITHISHTNLFITYIKQKAIPLQAWTVPEGSRRLKLPDFKTVSTW
jgi:hypothetical protein